MSSPLMYTSRELANIAKDKGLRFYNGAECRRCSGTLRYATTTACVACTKDNMLRYNERKREEKKQYAREYKRKLQEGLITPSPRSNLQEGELDQPKNKDMLKVIQERMKNKNK